MPSAGEICDAIPGATLSGVGTRLEVRDVLATRPVALDAAGPDTLTWLGPGLRLRQPTRLLGGVASEELLAALRAANEITIEAWIHPAAAVARGASPRRIVTYSADHSNRFFTLGQTTTGRYQVRLRTTETDDNGMSGRVEVSAPAGLSHVVFTRDSAGSIAVHVDGAPQLLAHDSIGGTFDDWRLDAQLPFDFALGDEIGGGRPWLGTYGLVAIYERALSSDEVRRNFYAELE